ncbi:hypothetical protein BC628DRAFT_1418194 [Trametes gibbosa]|nr:hypothetical protein BC628DRAFT_1418194 [Trametes gibbosa]
MSELQQSLAVYPDVDAPNTPLQRASDIIDDCNSDEATTTDRQDPMPSDYELKSSASPSQKRAVKVPTTPYKRTKVASSLSSDQRRNVNDAIKQLEPNVDRPFCVVTRASVGCTILEYAHVLPAATTSEVLNKLEWVWNMKHKTLNVDTRRNIHPLDATLHQYFHRTDNNKYNGWFWLPDTVDIKIISDMHDHYIGILAAAPSQHAKMRRNPDEFYKDQKVFKYRFVPFPAMQNSWAVRRLTVSRQENGSTAEAEVVQHYYPFDTMPVVSLHIPYHFVICDTGRKLDSVYGADVSKMAADFPQGSLMLLAVKNLYDAWMRANPVPTDLTTAVGMLVPGVPPAMAATQAVVVRDLPLRMTICSEDPDRARWGLRLSDGVRLSSRRLHPGTLVRVFGPAEGSEEFC